MNRVPNSRVLWQRAQLRTVPSESAADSFRSSHSTSMFSPLAVVVGSSHQAVEHPQFLRVNTMLGTLKTLRELSDKSCRMATIATRGGGTTGPIVRLAS